MPITKSAQKALRSSKRKEIANRKFIQNIEQTIKSAGAKNIKDVISKIDKAAKKGIYHENKAARLVSRLAKKAGAHQESVSNSKEE